MSFQTQNQACQQLTDEVDKEYKKMSDSIKETAETIKVQLDHLFTAGAIFYFFVLIPVFLLQAKYKLIMAETRSSTSHGI